MRFLPFASAVLLAASALPVSAQAEGRSGDGGASNSGGQSFSRDFARNGESRFNRRRGRVDQTMVLPFGYYDERFAGRSWEPNSYNDWWHERPERSYPRWMANNRNCERMWWSGGGWTC